MLGGKKAEGAVRGEKDELWLGTFDVMRIEATDSEQS